MAGMYGFNRYAPGQRPGTMQFFGGPQGRLQLGMGNLASKIRQSIDKPDPRKLGLAAGAAGNAAAMSAGPTAAGQAAGAAASQAAFNASAGAQPTARFAQRQAMVPRPMLPGAQGPDYGLGAPMTTPSAPTPPRPPMPNTTMAPPPGSAPGQSAPMPDPSARIAALGAPPQTPPGTPAPGQAPMVDPNAMVSTLNTPIDPNNYQAHPVGGKTMLLRNGADPSNASPSDVMVFENGQWVPGGDKAAQDLYDFLHIEDIGE